MRISRWLARVRFWNTFGKCLLNPMPESPLRKNYHSTACRVVLRSVAASLLLSSLAVTLQTQQMGNPPTSNVSVGDTVEFSFGPGQVRGVVESVDGRRVNVWFTYLGREQTRRVRLSYEKHAA